MQKDRFVTLAGLALFTLGAGLTGTEVKAQQAEEFSKASVLVEINATDGDVGFHARLDADAWKDATIDDPQGQNLFAATSMGRLAEQGLTQNDFESNEPRCAPDPDDPDAEVVPLSAFLDRFPAGSYAFSATTLGDESLVDSDELTHDLPAAPVGITFDGATVTWAAGNDLGRCQDDNLVAQGTIPDPATVPVVAWEVTVEPTEEAAVEPLRTFAVQLPGQVPLTVIVPPEFVNAYAAQGVTTFKVEVGAIEASGNRTFSQEEFELGGGT